MFQLPSDSLSWVPLFLSGLPINLPTSDACPPTTVQLALRAPSPPTSFNSHPITPLTGAGELLIS